MHAYLDTLTTVALLGTAKRSVPTPPAELRHLVQPATPEAQLLTYAATVNLYLQAARETEKTARLPLPAADPETKPVISGPAANCLQQMLGGHYRDLVPEFLTLVAQQQQRLPHHCLPQLLELGHYDKALRAGLLKVLTNRGLWLARQNVAWNYALAVSNAADRFTLGKLPERVAALTQMRAANAEQGLAALAGVWSTSSAKERLALLETLNTNLSVADETFLDAALDDKSKFVRQAAAELLKRIPDSAFVQRMTTHAKTMLFITREGLLKKRLAVRLELPSALAPAVSRDGVREEGKPKGIGKKAWRFQQIVSCVPLQTWRQTDSLTNILNACPEEDRGLLFTSWVAACEATGTAAEALELVTYIPSADAIKALAPLLTPAQVDAVTITLLRRERMLSRSHVGLLLLQTGAPAWGAALQKDLVASIKTSLKKWSNAWQARQVLELLVTLIPISLLPQLRTLAATLDDSPVQIPYTECLAKLEFRERMAQAINA